MWKYYFVNLCFVILVITVLSLQHSVGVFGPTAHEWTQTNSGPAVLGQAASFLQDTWRRGMVIKEWLMESNTSQWELFSTSNPVETDLLEARFHVANAEVFTEAMRANDRAVKELIRAETSIRAVHTLVKRNLAHQLTTITDEITDAETLERTNAIATIPFETIKSDLDHLIHSVRLSKA